MRSIFQGTGPSDNVDEIQNPGTSSKQNCTACDVRKEVSCKPGQTDRISFRTGTIAGKEARAEAGENPQTGGLMKGEWRICKMCGLKWNVSILCSSW